MFELRNGKGASCHRHRLDRGRLFGGHQLDGPSWRPWTY
jgi:hypothetical protein